MSNHITESHINIGYYYIQKLYKISVNNITFFICYFIQFYFYLQMTRTKIQRVIFLPMM